jgi:hypothetical protein
MIVNFFRAIKLLIQNEQGPRPVPCLWGKICENRRDKPVKKIEGRIIAVFQ